MTDDSRRPADLRATFGTLPVPGSGRSSLLYPIVDVDLCRMRGVDPVAFAAACFAGGALILQVRQKGSGSGAFVEVSRAIAALGRDRAALVIVNDRADVAVLAGAGGVHVGQNDLPVSAVRPMVGDEAVIGLSTHTTGQVDDALAGGADYVAVGPVYETGTKETGYGPRGLDLVRYAAGRGKPIVAIGGITLERAAGVRAAGAAALAVISDLFTGGDPESRVRAYVAALA